MSKMPNITHAQVVSALTALLTACVVLFKLNLTAEQQAAAISVIGTVVPAVWIYADAHLRGKRNEVVAAQHIESAAQLAAITVRPEGDDSLVPPGPPQALAPGFQVTPIPNPTPPAAG